MASIKKRTNKPKDPNTSSLNLSSSTIESEEFYRVENTLKLREGGKSAQVLFKKESKKKPKSEPKNSFPKSSDPLSITDGGLTIKVSKYSNTNMIIPTKRLHNTINPKATSQSSSHKKPKQSSQSNHKEKHQIDPKTLSLYNTSERRSNRTPVEKALNPIATPMNKTQPNLTMNTNINHNFSNEKKSLMNTHHQHHSMTSMANCTNTNTTLKDIDMNDRLMLIEKRKKYHVPRVKPRKKNMSMTENNTTNVNINQMMNQTNNANEENESRKLEKLKSLIENNERCCISEFQRHNLEQPNQRQFKDIEKKMKLLEANNVNVDELFIEEGEDGNNNEEEINEEENNAGESDEEQEEQLTAGNPNGNEELYELNHSKEHKHSNSHINNNPHLNHHINNGNLRRSKSEANNTATHIKESRKQRIDTLEYLVKIYQEINLDDHNINSYTNINHNPNDSIQEETEENKRTNSFRHSSNHSKKENLRRFDKRAMIANDDQGYYNHYENMMMVKKNNRTKEEIKEYMVRAQHNSKEKAIKVVEEEKTKQLKKFIGLAKLEEIIERNRQKYHKRHVNNEYYVGTQHSQNNKYQHSQSTIIDPNDYICNILESKQIISGHFRAIQCPDEEEEEIEDEHKEEVNDCKNSQLEESGEQSNITNTQRQEEEEKTSVNDVRTSQSLQKLNESLINKVNKTVSRFNELFSSDNLNQILRTTQNNKTQQSVSMHSMSNNEEIKEPIIHTLPILKNETYTSSSYNFLQEELEDYNDRFERFFLWIKMINRRNCLQSIIDYSNTRYRYKLGFQCLIVLFKSNPLSVLNYYANAEAYQSVLNDFEESIQRLSQFFKFKVLERIIQYINAKEDYEAEDNGHSEIGEVHEDDSEGDFMHPNEIEEDKREKDSNDSKEEMKKKVYDEEERKQIAFGITLIKLPFIVYSMQKIAEYAYNNYNMPSEGLQHSYSNKEGEYQQSHCEEQSKENDKSSINNHNNTYLYESFESKNSIMLYPNSEKSARLHRVYELINQQRDNNSYNNSVNEGESNSNSNRNTNNNYYVDSIQSQNNSQSQCNSQRNHIESLSERKSKKVTSLTELINKKPGIDLKNSMNSLKSKSSRSNSFDHEEKNSFTLPQEQIHTQPQQQDQIDKENYYQNEINLPLSTTHLRKTPMTKLEKCATISEQDVSADKDTLNLIEWESTIKSSHTSNPNAPIALCKDNHTPIKEQDIPNEETQATNLKEKRNYTTLSSASASAYNNNLETNEGDDNIIITTKPSEAQRTETSKFDIDKSTQQPPISSHTIDSDQSSFIFTDQQNNKIIFQSQGQSQYQSEVHSPKEVSSSGSIYSKPVVKQLTKVISPKASMGNLKHSFTKQEEDELINSITADVIQQLLQEEIIETKRRIIPKKAQKYMRSIMDHLDTSSMQISQTNSYNGSGCSPHKSVPSSSSNTKHSHDHEHDHDHHLDDNNFSSCSNNNTMNYSMFMRTVQEIKSELRLNQYNEKVAPKLLQVISSEIDSNYHSIQSNLQVPQKRNAEKLLKDLVIYEDKTIAFKNNKLFIKNSNFLNKKQVLSAFNTNTNGKDKEYNDSVYDTILNECVIDTANEVISHERLYGKIGYPLPWSNRTRQIKSRFDNNPHSKHQLIELVNRQLSDFLSLKMSLIPENNPHLDVDQLSQDRENKFMKSIGDELLEHEPEWRNFEAEETQIKLELQKIIMDQLLNEIVEILEHVNLSRKEPMRYHSKSIYACEDIPRLDFQCTTENDYDNDNIDTMNQ